MGWMGLLGLFDLAIELEKKIGECYDRMSGMATDEGLKKDLMKLAQEEIGHANLLRTGKNFGVKNPEFFSKGTMDLSLLENCLGGVNELLDELGQGTTTLSAALNRIVALEYFCEEAHLSNLVHIEEPSLKPLFEGLARDDAEHGERVSQLLGKYRSPA
jgi:rubrerythrin